MFPAYSHLTAYDRHKKLINDYFVYQKGSALTLKRDTSRDKTDADVLREQHRFLWDDDTEVPNDWETRLAKKYYDKLFKEYCIADLIYYKKNQVALRWRTENEVVTGKGQFQCGNKKCEEKNDLKTWEVNFGYVEHGEKKNALVKLRLCPPCSLKLNHHSKKREIKRKKSLKRLGKTEEIPATSGVTASEVAVVKVEKEDTVEPKAQETVNESEIWKEKLTESNEKSREEEFEEYFDELFM
ncbi:protein FRA10AC1 isoform X2 [Athalia rosae]|uniref:protein FRA10AC1 isoform X2 n=1 Tax=Athalia rosae TaxID=37344 RepID=UPI00203494CF|nr:protein FRA10AC1 isoform X2 [Athalia rosae]